MNRYSSYPSRPPAVPIPFHKLLKVVADRRPRQPADAAAAGADRGRELRGRGQRRASSATSPRTPRSAPTSRWSTASACERRARRCCARCARIGFRTPLWALADSHRITDLPVVGMAWARSTATSTSASRSPDVLCQAGDRQPRRATACRLLPPFFGGLMAYDGKATSPSTARATRAGSSTASRRPGSCSSSTSARAIFRNDLCNADVDLGDLLIHEGAADAGAERTRRRCSAPTAPTSCSTAPAPRTRSSPARCSSAATWCCSTATTTSRCTRARWCRPARSRCSCRPRATPFGMIGAVDWEAWDEKLPARADPRATRWSRTSRCADAPAAVPHGLHPARAPTTARSTTCARCSRRSATCATTCCGTRPGSATTPSTRCSRTTARCG